MRSALIFIFLAAVVVPVLAPVLVHAGGPVLRLNKNGVALCEDRDSKVDSNCYDPVSYLEDGKAQAVGTENSKSLRMKYQDAIYVFSTQAHLDVFTKNPQKYIPQFGGWCAYAVAAKKDKVDIDPKSFKIQDGRLLLFYDGLLADTKKKWQHDDKKNPNEYLKDADANWPLVKDKEP